MNPTRPTLVKSASKLLRSGWLKFALRWGIFVVGVAWILSQLTLRDRVSVVQPDGTVVSRALVAPADEASGLFKLDDGQTVGRDRIVSKPDRKTVDVRDPADPTAKVATPLWGIHLKGDINKKPEVDGLIVKDPRGTGGIRIAASDVVGDFTLRTPKPLVEKGINTMVREANPWLLFLAIAVFPVTMIATTVRWHEILRSQEVHVGWGQALVLTLVGNFYNSFLPGSTGGDFFKAYFVARQTPHKIRAIISVFIDRVIGLFALVLLGGTMAAYGFVTAPGGTVGEKLAAYDPLGSKAGLSPTAAACLNVTIGCLLIVIGSSVAGIVLASRTLRRALGVNWLIARLPMQHHLNKVREAARLYKRHAIRLPWWILLTLPVHITVVISAMIAGQAFGLSISWPYYFVCVPVMVLSAAIPISPQGAGVMEAIGFLLLSKQGVLVSEVLALTLSIRVVQMLWNLVGGIFVLRGGFEKPAAGSSFDAIADEEEAPEPASAGTLADPEPPLSPSPARAD